MAPVNPGFKNFKALKEQKKKRKEEKLLQTMKQEPLTELIPDDNIIKIEPIVTDKIVLSTISIAVPGSILDNAQSSELRTYLAGQIARAACIFKIDEVVVFDDGSETIGDKETNINDTDDPITARRCNVLLARILQYLECPQYLRKSFFPMHKDLSYAGVLNPLDAPHHLRQSNDFIFREGVVSNKLTKAGKGSKVNVGLLQDVTIDKPLLPGIRVTVKLNSGNPKGGKKLEGVVVSPLTPTIETGVYWGYSVRIANNLSQVFAQSPYKNGYDLTIGTSDKGTKITDIAPKSLSFQHAIVVFGGLNGLESEDNEDPSLLFDHYFNTIPNQGSRTVRTEEAILLSLSILGDKMDAQNKSKEFILNDSLAQSSDTHNNQKVGPSSNKISKFN